MDGVTTRDKIILISMILAPFFFVLATIIIPSSDIPDERVPSRYIVEDPTPSGAGAVEYGNPELTLGEKQKRLVGNFHNTPYFDDWLMSDSEVVKRGVNFCDALATGQAPSDVEGMSAEDVIRFTTLVERTLCRPDRLTPATENDGGDE